MCLLLCPLPIFLPLIEPSTSLDIALSCLNHTTANPACLVTTDSKRSSVALKSALDPLSTSACGNPSNSKHVVVVPLPSTPTSPPHAPRSLSPAVSTRSALQSDHHHPRDKRPSLTRRRAPKSRLLLSLHTTRIFFDKGERESTA